MTTEATLPSTSASPTARQVWTRARGIVLALVVLLAGEHQGEHGVLRQRRRLWLGRIQYL